MIFYVFNRSFNAFSSLAYSKVFSYIRPWFACQIPLYYSRFMAEQAHLTRLQIACEFRSYLQRDFNKMASSVKKQIEKYSHNLVVSISDFRISTCCKIFIWNSHIFLSSNRLQIKILHIAVNHQTSHKVSSTY